MYEVDVSVWVRVALMHFEGPAARWLQSMDHRVRTTSWSELCSWIHERFRRDQHELLIRQLYRIKQTDKFCELVDQLQSYNCNTDPLYYTTRFIDGLRDDLKFVITAQRPKDLDIACCLTLLQEEQSTPQYKEFKRSESGFNPKPSVKGAYPLPRPPLQPNSDNIPDDRSKQQSQKQSSVETNLAVMFAYMLAKGLCRKCGEKWYKGHKCADSMQCS
jgi:hypothetical protein